MPFLTIYLRSFHTGNQLVSFWYGVSWSETPFLSIYFFTVIINIFRSRTSPTTFLFFSFLDNTNIEDTVSDQVAASSSTADLHQGGCRRGEKGAPKTSFFYVYIYMYIFTHAHLVTLQNVQRCCFLAFFLLIIYIFWSISSIHTTREDFWNPCTGDQQQV